MNIGDVLGLGASTALSAYGNVLNNKANVADYAAKLNAELQQAQQATEEARARNAVLQQYQGLLTGHINSNENAFNTNLAAYAPEAQAANTAKATATRGGAISSAIDDGNTAMPQLGPTDSPAVAKAFQDAYATKLGQSRDSGAALARMGGIGDAWQNNAQTNSDAAHNIDTTNVIARNEISNLPAAQDFAGFGTRRIIYQPPPVNRGVGNLLMQLGGLGGAVSGAGGFSKAGDAVGSSAANWFGGGGGGAAGATAVRPEALTGLFAGPI